MRFTILLLLLGISLLITTDNAFAIDYRDSSGYTPSWAMQSIYF